MQIIGSLPKATILFEIYRIYSDSIRPTSSSFCQSLGQNSSESNKSRRRHGKPGRHILLTQFFLTTNKSHTKRQQVTTSVSNWI